jgi:bacterioferritin
MKGDAKVIEFLNEALSEELTAINQYFLHSELCENAGYAALHKRIKRESIDEMKHAEALIERILFLDGTPNMSKYRQINIGAKVDEMLKNDLALEKGAVEMYNRGIKLSGDAGDHGTRDLLQGILKDEEGHLDFIETQLSLIQDLGLPAYLTQQMEGAAG